jgi:hypothetical protein
MNEAMTSRAEDKPCKYHEDFVKSVVSTNELQNTAIARIEKIVTQINEALIGTLEKQGLIGRIDTEIKSLQRDVNELMEWKDQAQSAIRSIIFKVIGSCAGLVVVGAVVAIAVVKWMVG